MKVFLSFSFKYQDQADALAAALRGLSDVESVFLSSDTLVGGQRWMEELQEGIRDAVLEAAAHARADLVVLARPTTSRVVPRMEAMSSCVSAVGVSAIWSA